MYISYFILYIEETQGGEEKKGGRKEEGRRREKAI